MNIVLSIGLWSIPQRHDLLVLGGELLFSIFQLLGAFCTLQLYWSVPKRHDLLVLGGYLLFSTFQLYWVPLALCNNIGCVPKRHDLLVLGGYLFCFLEHIDLFMPLDDGGTLKMLLELQ